MNTHIHQVSMTHEEAEMLFQLLMNKYEEIAIFSRANGLGGKPIEAQLSKIAELRDKMIYPEV